MNDKYISVLKFKQSLAKLTVESGDKKYAEAIARTLSEVVPYLLDDSPAADVQTVKRGKWEYYKNNGIFDTYKCTLCGEKYEMYMDIEPTTIYKYCPNCGARMDGDTECQ